MEVISFMKSTYSFLISLLVLNPLIATNNPIEKKSNLKKPEIVSTIQKKVSFAPDVIDNEIVKDSSEVVQQCSPTKECIKGIAWGSAALILAYISTELGLSAFDIWSFSLHRFAPIQNSYLMGGLLRTGGCIAFSSATCYALYKSAQAFKKAANKNNKQIAKAL
jgi:hypothetical protein